MNQSQSKSYIMMISSMLIFGTIGIFRRSIPISSALLACIRGFIGALVLFLYVKLSGQKFSGKAGKREVLLLMAIGVAIGSNWILLFEAYRYTTIAIATLCYYMQPTIIVILAPFILKEKLTAKKAICAFVSVVGMVFVSGIIGGGGIQLAELKGVFFGLGAAALYAVVVLANKLVVLEDAYERTIIQLLGAAVVLVPYLAITEDFSAVQLDGKAIAMLLILCVVHTGFAYALYFGSLNNLSAQSVAVLGYIDPVSALILSALILNEKLTVFGIIGAVLIIGAALVSELSKTSNN